ncbi:MAG: DMT family transporter [Ornithinimicrobium sp.]|uniref:DMT family transporter n=1 Tax=Ornithinimicrobium sp. TaxID=1977084 RepID=UPI0026DFA76E|nr:DMT family transporter [Ornithinimicrobium sp.]MDO5740914.1 DMT family transporter [Ornithinimicrobium sp.]
MPALLLLVLATLFWAGNYVVGERAVTAIDPVSLTWLRWAFAALPLVVIAQVVERPHWPTVLRRWRLLIVMAGLGVAGYPLLLYTALQHTTAVSASLINAANPALIIVLAVLLRGSRVGGRSWVGVGVGLIGVLLVLTRGDVDRLLSLALNVGDLLMLGAILVWTLYTLLGQSLGVPVLTATAVQAVFTVVALVPFLAVDGLTVPSTTGMWWAVLFLAAFPSLGSYICWNLAITRVSSGTAAASMNLVTVFTIVIAVLLGEPPTVVQLTGGLLVIGGVLLAQSRRSQNGGGSCA